MRVGYRRISSDTQNMERQELPDCERVFEETMSGAVRERPQLNEMLDFIRSGDEVVVHELSRLARSLIDLQGIVQTIVDKGCSITFLSERLTFSADNDDPMAKLQLHVMGAFAEFERSLIRKRQAEGIAKAKAAGKFKGRQPTIDSEEIIKLHQAKISPTQICKFLGISRSSVYRAIKEHEAINSEERA